MVRGELRKQASLRSPRQALRRNCSLNPSSYFRSIMTLRGISWEPATVVTAPAGLEASAGLLRVHRLHGHVAAGAVVDGQRQVQHHGAQHRQGHPLAIGDPKCAQHDQAVDGHLYLSGAPAQTILQIQH